MLTPDVMDGRNVVSGTVGCPKCKAEFRIADGVVEFGRDPLLGTGSRSDDITVEEIPDPQVMQALLALHSPGGYVVLVGSVTRTTQALAGLMEGIHFIGINLPPDVRGSSLLSPLRSTAAIPLRSSMARGVVLGTEYALEPWLGEAARVLLRGLRLVAVAEETSAPGVSQLAAGQGLWVGEKS